MKVAYKLEGEADYFVGSLPNCRSGSFVDSPGGDEKHSAANATAAATPWVQLEVWFIEIHWAPCAESPALLMEAGRRIL